MPIIKHSDKAKSKSVSSSLDKVPPSGSGGSKYNLKLEKVSKTDGSGNTASKKLKCVTSNFKCLFYKRKGRDSDGRSESSKSSSPTGESIGSSSPAQSDGFHSPELVSSKPSSETPIPAERRSRPPSSGSGTGTLDRPVPVPRTSIRPALIPLTNRIPANQVIYNEESSLHNFHLQGPGNFSPQNHLLFRPPTQNFRHPVDSRHVEATSLPELGPPLPPRNSNFPSVVYAPRSHGPVVHYVRGPFPPSRHPYPRSSATLPHLPPQHLMHVRPQQHQHQQQSFILRYPPPPRVLFRSPYEHSNYYHHQSDELYNDSHLRNSSQEQSLHAHGTTKSHPSGPTENGPPPQPNMQLPSIPPRSQSLSPQSFNSFAERLNDQMHHKGRFQVQKPLQIVSREGSPSMNNHHHNMRNENGKVESRDNNYDTDVVKNTRRAQVGVYNDDENYGDDVCQRSEINLPLSSSPSCGQAMSRHSSCSSPLWPTVLIDHKLPRVPHPTQDHHQRQIVTESMRQLGNRKASLKSDTNTIKTNASSSCSDLQRMDDKSGRNCVPWFRGFASRVVGETSSEVRQRNINNNNGSAVNNNVEKDSPNLNCVRCSKVLPKPGSGGILVSQPVECSICSLRVCKSCAVWNQAKNTLTCGHCHPPTSIDRKANFWLDGLSQGDSSFVTAERDKTTEDVRDHLEQLVESYIDEGIAAISLARLFDNPQYDVLFHRFHQKLSDGLMNLGYSLKLAIENKPMSETPTSAHATLTNLLVQVKEAAMELPLMEPPTATIHPAEKTKDELIADANAENVKRSSGGEGQHSYEDVLATAILNKVVLNGQKTRNKSDSPMSLVDSAVQTDSEMSETSEIVTQKNQYNVQGWVTNLEKRSPQQHSSNLSDDDLSMGTSSSNWSNEGASHRGSTHQQIVIEEQVEEITTTYESDSDIGHAPPVRNRKLRKSGRHQRANNTEVPASVITEQDSLFGVDISNFEKRAPFPEGGVDIISPTEAGVLPEDEQADPKASALLVSQISEWEQNWLFKRRKQLFKKRNLMAEAVPMLVPNPNEEGVEPQIGAEKASDLSDLSDHVNEDDEDGDFIMSSSDEEEDIKGKTKDTTESANSEATPQPVNNIEVITTQIQPEGKPPLQKQNNLGKDSSSIESIKSVTRNPAPKVTKPERKAEKGIVISRAPQDCKASLGRTAKFICTIAESSPAYSVAWFFEGVLVTSEKGKRWIYSDEKAHNHYLYVYDVDEKDTGSYHISVFDQRGNETKHSFKLVVTAGEQRKNEPPTFTVLKDIVTTPKGEPVLTIPFEICGFPEPYLEVYRNSVEISKLSHVVLEDEGDGKWVLQIRKNETDFSVDGEYIAVAKNKGGMTKVTFQIQHGEGMPIATAETQKSAKENLATPSENPAKSLSPQPRPVSAASEVSSIEETLRETSQSMDRNQTLIKEDYEDLLEWEKSRNLDSSKMTIAEREKLKWQNPVNLPNNPYAPENLAKRIRQRENSGLALPPSKSGDITVSSSDDERATSNVDRIAQNYQKFSRDYYIHGAPPAVSKLPSGPKFPAPSLPASSSLSKSSSSISSREPSAEKEELPKEQAVANKTPVPSQGQDPISTAKVVKPSNETPLERPKVSLEKRESIRDKYEAEVKKENPDFEKRMPVRRPPSSSPRPSPEKDVRSSNSPSPSPVRSRQPSVDSNASKKDSAELAVIRLPSVKQLAQQFNKEPTPEDAKLKDTSKAVPPQHQVMRNLIKDSKSIQQQKRAPVEPVPKERPIIQKSTPQVQAPLQRQDALLIETPSSSMLMERVERESSPKVSSHDAPVHERHEVDAPYPKEIMEALEDSDSSYDKLSDNETDTDQAAPPPPLPITPPPPKTPVVDIKEDPILALFDPLSKIDNEAGLPPPITPSTHPTFNRSISRQDSDQMVLPSIPDSYLPRWAQPKAESSVDLDLLQFELLQDEQDHMPPSIMPDTPQPASLATTITDDALTETESDYGLTDEIDTLKADNVRQPLYKAFNALAPTPTGSKRNSWNTSSSFVYSPTNSLRKRDWEFGDSDLDTDDQHSNSNWSENTPSVIPRQVPARPSTLSSDGNMSESSTAGSVASSKAGAGRPVKKSNSRVMGLAAQFEAKDKTRTRKDSTESDASSRKAQAQEKPKEKPQLVRRPTAMEVLATPSPSLMAKKDEADEAELRKLRRSIVRGARSGTGVKTAGESSNEPILARSQSLSPLEVERRDAHKNPPLARPRSLHLPQDFEGSFDSYAGKVHSLTARSVSREFREGLRLSHPSPPNMNIKVTPRVSPTKESTPSDSKPPIIKSNETDVATTNDKDILNRQQLPENESNGESVKNGDAEDDDMLTSAALNKSKRNGSSSILSRAAFWDKRVKDGIIDDDVAIKEFPKVDGVSE